MFPQSDTLSNSLAASHLVSLFSHFHFFRHHQCTRKAFFIHSSIIIINSIRKHQQQQNSEPRIQNHRIRSSSFSVTTSLLLSTHSSPVQLTCTFFMFFSSSHCWLVDSGHCLPFGTTRTQTTFRLRRSTAIQEVSAQQRRGLSERRWQTVTFA